MNRPALAYVAIPVKGKPVPAPKKSSAADSLAGGGIHLEGTSTFRRRMLLDSYLKNMWRGSEVVDDMIRGDLCRCADLGAKLRVQDLLIVLQWFVTDRPLLK